jgi:hypothetical protein
MSAAAPAVALVALIVLVVAVVVLKGLRKPSKYWDRAARERRHLQPELPKAKIVALRRGERNFDDVSDDAPGRPPREGRERDHHPEH